MEKKQKNYSLLPSLFLLLLFAFILVNFSKTEKEKAEKEIKSKCMTLVKEYVHTVKEDIENMTNIGLPMASTMSHYTDYTARNLLAALPVMESLVQHSQAYCVILADETGSGFKNDGQKINLSEESYFANDSFEHQYYAYTTENVTGTAAIVSVIPIKKNNKPKLFMYMYYPVEQINNLFYDFSLYGHSVMLFSLENNEIANSDGITSSEFIGDNTRLLDVLGGTEIDSRLKDVEKRMLNRKTGDIKLNTHSIFNYAIYVPLGINEWYITMVINDDYITNQIALKLEDTRNLISTLSTILVIFVITIIVFAVITRLKYSEHNKSLETKADTDLLTDLYNKMATERKIKQYIDCKENEQAIMFVLDIDNFKKINDTRGHAFGDEVLRAIAVRLQTAFRTNKIVGRTGGDEFIVFIKNISDEEVIEKEIKKLEHVFHNFTTGEYVKYAVTASIGCAIYPKDAHTFEDLYKAADSALYTAKNRGKNQIAMYEKRES